MNTRSASSFVFLLDNIFKFNVDYWIFLCNKLELYVEIYWISSFQFPEFYISNVSGGNVHGAGKFGVGKSVYSAASKTYKYWFDSYTIEGKYIANVNNRGYMYPEAFEGDEAKSEIKKATGLDPKTTHGTRIIIFDPREDLIESIESKEIFEFIRENWWVSIDRMAGTSGIYVNDEKVVLPQLAENKNEWALPSPYKVSPGRIVKRCVLNVSTDEDIPWHGIAYFRVGMKIQNVAYVKFYPDLFVVIFLFLFSLVQLMIPMTNAAHTVFCHSFSRLVFVL